VFAALTAFKTLAALVGLAAFSALAGLSAFFGLRGPVICSFALVIYAVTEPVKAKCAV
jgi:hypothetical protein